MEITSKRFVSIPAKTKSSNSDQLLGRQQLEVKEGHLHRQERQRRESTACQPHAECALRAFGPTVASVPTARTSGTLADLA